MHAPSGHRRGPRPSATPSLGLGMHLLLLIGAGVAWTARLAAAHDQTHDFIHTFDFVHKPRFETRTPGRDNTLVSFVAFDRTFEALVAPTKNFLHPDLEIEIVSPDARQHRLHRREEVHLMTHQVAQSGWTLATQGPRAGDIDSWAHLTFPDPRAVQRVAAAADPTAAAAADAAAVFQGAFIADGVLYHIRTIDAYMRSRRAGDIAVPAVTQRHPRYRGARMIIYRDRDTSPVPVVPVPPAAPLRASYGAALRPAAVKQAAAAAAEKAEKAGLRMLGGGGDETDPLARLLNGFGASAFSEAALTRRDASAPVHTQPVSRCGMEYDTHAKLSYEARAAARPGQAALSFSASDSPPDNVLGRKLHRLFARADKDGCPTSPQVLYIAAAADCSYVKNFGNKTQALAQILNDFNLASAVYKRTFNLALGLIKVTLMDVCSTGTTTTPWNQDCGDNGYAISERLSDFSKWRGTSEATVSNSKVQPGAWHLLTKCNSGASVGVAWVGQVCNAEAKYQEDASSSLGSAAGGQWVSGVAVSAIVPNTWKTIAHEQGHLFGAIHDCTTSSCPCISASSCGCLPCDNQCNCDGAYIMNPTDDSSTNDFSPGSIRTICSNVRTLATCLQSADAAVTTIAAGICGNGIREAGEECDCGSDCATDSCCDGPSCKLKSGAKCDDYNDSCCKSCQFMPRDTVCRPSTGYCDIQEVCTGTTGACPSDTFRENGETCQTTAGIAAECVSGVCTSRDLQCTSNSTLVRTNGVCPGQSKTCQLLCSQTGASNVCVKLNGYMIDGTPCGSGGHCKAGECTGMSAFDKLRSFYIDSPQIAIPVTVVIGLLLLGLIYSCCRRCCFAGRGARDRVTVPDPNKPTVYTTGAATGAAASAGAATTQGTPYPGSPNTHAQHASGYSQYAGQPYSGQPYPMQGPQPLSYPMPRDSSSSNYYNGYPASPSPSQGPGQSRPVYPGHRGSSLLQAPSAGAYPAGSPGMQSPGRLSQAGYAGGVYPTTPSGLSANEPSAPPLEMMTGHSTQPPRYHHTSN